MADLALNASNHKRLQSLCDASGMSPDELIEAMLSHYPPANGEAAGSSLPHADADPHADAFAFDDHFFRTIIEHSADIVAVYDTQMRHIYINPAVYRLANLSENDFLGKTDRELGAHKEDELKLWEDSLTKVIKTKQQVMVEMGSMHFDNDLYFETSMVPLIGEQGQVLSVITISRNVTERRRFLHELEGREAHYRQLFTGSDAIQILIDPKSAKIIDANPAACKFYGYDHKTLTGMRVWDINRDSEESVQQQLKELFQSKERTYVFTHRLATGEDRTVRANIAPIQIGDSFIMHAIITDITGVVEAENALIRSERRFRGLAENSPDTVYIYNIEKNVVEYINNKSLFGYPIDYATNPALINERIHPDDVADVMHQWDTFIHDDGLTNIVTTLTYRLYSDVREDWYWVQKRIVILEYDAQGHARKIIVTLTDITALKASERAAVESEQRYQSLISAMAEGIVLQLASGEIVTCNHAAESILGLTYDQMVGRTSVDPRWRAIHKDGTEFPGEEHPAMVTLSTGEAQSDVIMGVHKPSGEQTWISINTQPLFKNGDENPYAVVATFTDITQLTLREQQLRILTQVVEQSPNSIIVTDPDGLITYVNTHFTQLTGYTLEDVIGENPRIQQSGQTPDETYDQMWRTIKSGKIWRGELLNRKKNGELYWEDIVIAPIKNQHDEITHFAAVKQDITARRLADDALRKSEERFRTLVSSMDDIIFTLDTRQRHTGVYGNWLKRYGVPPEHFLGRRSEEIMPPEEAKVHYRANQRALSGEQVVYEWHTLDERSGKTLYYQTRLSPIRDAQDNITGIVGVGREITSLREAENAIRESEQRYRSLFENTNDAVFIISLDEHHLMVNKRAAEIMGKRAEDIIGRPSFQFIQPHEVEDAKLRMKEVREGKKIPIYERTFRRPDGSTFIGEVNIALVRDEDGNPMHVQSIIRDISDRKEAEQQALKVALEHERGRVFSRFIETFSHEFRTPLSIIGTRLYLLERQLEPEQRKKHSEVIQDQVMAITSLVDALVMMTRLEHNVHPQKMRGSLNELLNLVVTQMKPVIEESGVNFTSQIDPDLPLIHADFDGLNDSIKRVLSNAFRYTEVGGHVSLSARHVDDVIEIKVSDTGIGIPPEMLHHIFDAFYRVDNARSTSGFGLGLAIAHKVFEYHGGKIEVESEVNEGSTFTLTLPVVQVQASDRMA